MTTDTPPPVNQRCQIYSEATSVRCINPGTHWVPWGCQRDTGEAEHYSWECDGEHLYGKANSAAIPTQREAA